MKRIVQKSAAQTADTQCVRQRDTSSEGTTCVSLFDMSRNGQSIREQTAERWMMDEAQLARSSTWGSMNACYFEKHLLDSIIAGNYNMTLRSRRSVSLVVFRTQCHHSP